MPEPTPFMRNIYDDIYQRKRFEATGAYTESDAIDQLHNSMWFRKQTGDISSFEYDAFYGQLSPEAGYDRRSKQYNTLANTYENNELGMDAIEEDFLNSQYLSVFIQPDGSYKFGIMDRNTRLAQPYQSVGYSQRSAFFEAQAQQFMTGGRFKAGEFLLPYDKLTTELEQAALAEMEREGNIDHTELLQPTLFKFDDVGYVVTGAEGILALTEQEQEGYNAEKMLEEFKELIPALYTAYNYTGNTDSYLINSKNTHDFWYRVNKTLNEDAVLKSTMYYMVEDKNFTDYILPSSYAFVRESIIKDPDMKAEIALWGATSAAGAIAAGTILPGVGHLAGLAGGALVGGLRFLGRYGDKAATAIDRSMKVTKKIKDLRKAGKLSTANALSLQLEAKMRIARSIGDWLLPSRIPMIIANKMGIVKHHSVGEQFGMMFGKNRRIGYLAQNKMKLVPLDFTEGLIEGGLVEALHQSEMGQELNEDNIAYAAGLEGLISIGLNPAMRTVFGTAEGVGRFAVGKTGQLGSYVTGGRLDAYTANLRNRLSLMGSGRRRTLTEISTAIDKADKLGVLSKKYDIVFGNRVPKKITATKDTLKYLFPDDPRRRNRKTNFLDVLYDTVYEYAQETKQDNPTDFTFEMMDKIMTKLVEDSGDSTFDVKHAGIKAIKILDAALDGSTISAPAKLKIKNNYINKFHGFNLIFIAQENDLTVDELIEKIDYAENPDTFDPDVWIQTLGEEERTLFLNVLSEDGKNLNDIVHLTPEEINNYLTRMKEKFEEDTSRELGDIDKLNKERETNASLLSKSIGRPVIYIDAVGNKVVANPDGFDTKAVTLEEGRKIRDEKSKEKVEPTEPTETPEPETDVDPTPTETYEDKKNAAVNRALKRIKETSDRGNIEASQFFTNLVFYTKDPLKQAAIITRLYKVFNGEMTLNRFFSYLNEDHPDFVMESSIVQEIAAVIILKASGKDFINPFSTVLRSKHKDLLSNPSVRKTIDRLDAEVLSAEKADKSMKSIVDPTPTEPVEITETIEESRESDRKLEELEADLPVELKDTLAEITRISNEISQLKLQLSEMSTKNKETKEVKEFDTSIKELEALNEQLETLFKSLGIRTEDRLVDLTTIKNKKKLSNKVNEFIDEDIAEVDTNLKNIEEDKKLLFDVKRIVLNIKEDIETRRRVLLDFLNNRRNNETEEQMIAKLGLTKEFVDKVKNKSIESKEFNTEIKNSKLSQVIEDFIKAIDSPSNQSKKILEDKKKELIKNKKELKENLEQYFKTRKEFNKLLNQIQKKEKELEKLGPFKEISELRKNINRLSLNKEVAASRLIPKEDLFSSGLQQFAYHRYVVRSAQQSKVQINDDARKKKLKTIDLYTWKTYVKDSYISFNYIDSFLKEKYPDLKMEDTVDMNTARDMITDFAMWRNETSNRHRGINMMIARLSGIDVEAMNAFNELVHDYVSIGEFTANDQPLLKRSVTEAETSRPVPPQDSIPFVITEDTIGEYAERFLDAARLLQTLKNQNGQYSHLGLVIAMLHQAGLGNINFNHPIFHMGSELGPEGSKALEGIRPVILEQAGAIEASKDGRLAPDKLYRREKTDNNTIHEGDYMDVIVDVEELTTVLLSISKKLGDNYSARVESKLERAVVDAKGRVESLDKSTTNYRRQLKFAEELHQGLLDYVKTIPKENRLRAGFNRDTDVDANRSVTEKEYTEIFKDNFIEQARGINKQRLLETFVNIYEDYVTTRPKTIDSRIKELYIEIIDSNETTQSLDRVIDILLETTKLYYGIKNETDMGDGTLDWMPAEEAGRALSDAIFRRNEVSTYRRNISTNIENQTDPDSPQDLVDRGQPNISSKLQPKSVRHDMPFSTKNLRRNYEEALVTHRMKHSLKTIEAMTPDEVTDFINDLLKRKTTKEGAIEEYIKDRKLDKDKELTAKQKEEAFREYYIPSREIVGKIKLGFDFLPQISNRTPGETITNFEQWQKMVMEVMLDFPVIGLNLIHDGRFYVDGIITGFQTQVEAREKYAEELGKSVSELTKDEKAKADEKYNPQPLFIKRDESFDEESVGGRLNKRIAEGATPGMASGMLTFAGFFQHVAWEFMNKNYEGFAKRSLELGQEKAQTIGIDNIFSYQRVRDHSFSGQHITVSMLISGERSNKEIQEFLDNLVYDKLGYTQDDVYLNVGKYVLESALQNIESHIDMNPESLESLQKLNELFDFKGILEDLKNNDQTTDRVKLFREFMKKPTMVQLYWAGLEGTANALVKDWQQNADWAKQAEANGITLKDIKVWATFLNKGGAALRATMINEVQGATNTILEGLGMTATERVELINILENYAKQEELVKADWLAVYGDDMKEAGKKRRDLIQAHENYVEEMSDYLSQGRPEEKARLKEIIRKDTQERINNVKEYLKSQRHPSVDRPLTETDLDNPEIFNKHYSEIYRLLTGFNEAWKEMPLLRVLNEKNAQPIRIEYDEMTKKIMEASGLDPAHVEENWLMGGLLLQYHVFQEFGIDTAAGRLQLPFAGARSPYTSPFGSYRSEEKPYGIWQTLGNRFPEGVGNKRDYVNKLIAIDLALRVSTQLEPAMLAIPEYTMADYFAQWQAESDHTVQARARSNNFWNNPSELSNEIGRDQFTKNEFGGRFDENNKPLWSRRTVKDQVEITTKVPAGISSFRPTMGSPGNLMQDKGSLFLRKKFFENKVKEQDKRIDNFNKLADNKLDDNLNLFVSGLLTGSHPFDTNTLPVASPPATEPISNVFSDESNEQKVYKAMRNFKESVLPWAMERGYFTEIKNKQWARLWILWDHDRIMSDTLRQTRGIVKGLRTTSEADYTARSREIRMTWYDKLFTQRSIAHEVKTTTYDPRELDVFLPELGDAIDTDAMSYLQLAKVISQRSEKGDPRVFTAAPRHLVALDEDTAFKKKEVVATVEGPVAVHHLETGVAMMEHFLISKTNEYIQAKKKEDSEIGAYLRELESKLPEGQLLAWWDLERMYNDPDPVIRNMASDIFFKAIEEASIQHHRNFTIYLDPDSETRGRMVLDPTHEGKIKRMWGSIYPLLHGKVIGAPTYHLTREGLQEMLINTKSTLLRQIEDRSITQKPYLGTERSLHESLEAGFQTDLRKKNEILLKAFEIMEDSELDSYTLTDDRRSSSFDPNERHKTIDIDKLGGLKGMDFDTAYAKSYYSAIDIMKTSATKSGNTRLSRVLDEITSNPNDTNRVLSLALKVQDSHGLNFQDAKIFAASVLNIDYKTFTEIEPNVNKLNEQINKLNFNPLNKMTKHLEKHISDSNNIGVLQRTNVDNFKSILKELGLKGVDNIPELLDYDGWLKNNKILAIDIETDWVIDGKITKVYSIAEHYSDRKENKMSDGKNLKAFLKRVEAAQKEGYKVVTFNGNHFDWVQLGNLTGEYDLALRIAMRSFDLRTIFKNMKANKSDKGKLNDYAKNILKKEKTEVGGWVVHLLTTRLKGEIDINNSEHVPTYMKDNEDVKNTVEELNKITSKEEINKRIKEYTEEDGAITVELFKKVLEDLNGTEYDIEGDLLTVDSNMFPTWALHILNKDLTASELRGLIVKSRTRKAGKFYKELNTEIDFQESALNEAQILFRSARQWLDRNSASEVRSKLIGEEVNELENLVGFETALEQIVGVKDPSPSQLIAAKLALSAAIQEGLDSHGIYNPLDLSRGLDDDVDLWSLKDFKQFNKTFKSNDTALELNKTIESSNLNNEQKEMLRITFAHLARMNPEFFNDIDLEIATQPLYKIGTKDRVSGVFGVKKDKFSIIVDPTNVDNNTELVEIILHETIGHMGVERFIRKDEAHWISVVEWIKSYEGQVSIRDFVTSLPKYSKYSGEQLQSLVAFYQNNPEEWAALYVSHRVMLDVTHDKSIIVPDKHVESMVGKIVRSVRRYLQTITDALFRFKTRTPKAYEMMEKIVENSYGFNQRAGIHRAISSRTPSEVSTGHPNAENMYNFLNPKSLTLGDQSPSLFQFRDSSPLTKEQIDNITKTETTGTSFETLIDDLENIERELRDIENDMNNAKDLKEKDKKRAELVNKLKEKEHIEKQISEIDYKNMFGQDRRTVLNNRKIINNSKREITHSRHGKIKDDLLIPRNYITSLLNNNEQGDLDILKTFLADSFEKMGEHRGEYVLEGTEQYLAYFPSIYLTLNKLATNGIFSFNTTQSDRTYLNNAIPIVLFSRMIASGLENTTGNLQNPEGIQSFEHNYNELMILEQEAADYDKGFTEEGKLDTDRFERIKEGAIRFIVNEKDISETDPDYNLIKQYAKKYKEFLQQMTDIMFDAGVLSEPEFTDPNRNIILTLKRKIKNMENNKVLDEVLSKRDALKDMIKSELELKSANKGVVDPIGLYMSNILPDLSNVTDGIVDSKFLKSWDLTPDNVKKYIDQRILNSEDERADTLKQQIKTDTESKRDYIAREGLEINLLRHQMVEGMYEEASSGTKTLKQIIPTADDVIVNTYNRRIKESHTNLVSKFQALSGSYLAKVIGDNNLVRPNHKQYLINSNDVLNLIDYKLYLLMNRIGSTSFLPQKIVGIPSSYDLLTNPNTKGLFNNSISDIVNGMVRGPVWNASTVSTLKQFTDSTINADLFLTIFENVIENNTDLSGLNIIDNSVKSLFGGIQRPVRSRLLEDIQILRRKLQITGGVATRAVNNVNPAVDTINDFTSTLLGPNLTVATPVVEGIVNTTSLMFGGPRGFSNFFTTLIDSITLGASHATKNGRIKQKELASGMAYYAKYLKHNRYEMDRSLLFDDEAPDHELSSTRRFLRKSRILSNSVNGAINTDLRMVSTLSYRKFLQEIIEDGRFKTLVEEINKNRDVLENRKQLKEIVSRTLGSSHGRVEAVYQMAQMGLLDIAILNDIDIILDKSSRVYGVYSFGKSLKSYISEQDRSGRSRLNDAMRRLKNWEDAVVHLNIINPTAMDLDTTDVPLFRLMRHYKSYPNVYASQRIFRDLPRYGPAAFLGRTIRFMLQEAVYMIIIMLAAGVSAETLRRRFSENPAKEISYILSRNPSMGFAGEAIVSAFKGFLEGNLAKGVGRPLAPVGFSLLSGQLESLKNITNPDGKDFGNYARLLTLAPHPVIGQAFANPFTRAILSHTLGKQKSVDQLRRNQQQGPRREGFNEDFVIDTGNNNNMFFTKEEKNLNNIIRELYPQAFLSHMIEQYNIPRGKPMQEPTQAPAPATETLQPERGRVDVAPSVDPLEEIQKPRTPDLPEELQ